MKPKASFFALSSSFFAPFAGLLCALVSIFYAVFVRSLKTSLDPILKGSSLFDTVYGLNLFVSFWGTAKNGPDLYSSKTQRLKLKQQTASKKGPASGARLGGGGWFFRGWAQL